MSILLVAGLGNPGREYAFTRHNAGFAVVDALARELGLSWQKSRPLEAETARWPLAPGRTVLLVKPLTYMNESGRAVQAVAGFHKIPVAGIAAVYDDLTIELGRRKVSVTGSAGGHNGVASLLAHLGPGFTRYRLGIGPKAPAAMDLKDFVLSPFTSEQQTLFDQSLPSAVTGLRFVVSHGADLAMNELNRRPEPPLKPTDPPTTSDS
jgi:PTH1 family peptidyl-tRNA hydrolase